MEPADASLVVEVVSPGSTDIDRVLKVHEYQAAEIPAYLVVDLQHHELIGFTLGPDGVYTGTVGDPVRLTVRGSEVEIAWGDIELS